ncbi:MAG TPA: hypothetical protein VJ911_02695 [Cryomorphaceae bacterium]|nr:hypothetical protein [Cryomorphaceae bacterium]
METTVDQPNQGPQHLSVKDWMITILITAIPLVGLIMLFVWSFGENTNKSKSNWAKATLLWYVIVIVLSFVFVALFGTAAFLGSNMDM